MHYQNMTGPLTIASKSTVDWVKVNPENSLEVAAGDGALSILATAAMGTLYFPFHQHFQ